MFPVESERISYLFKDTSLSGKYVVYWMQGAQRINYNQALFFALSKANELSKPLLVYFCLIDYPEAGYNHYKFMLENIFQLRESLKQIGIRMIIESGNPVENVLKICQDACLCITEKAYLRGPVQWRRDIAFRINCSFIQIETETIIPVETVSDKEEYSAFTIRKKIHKHLPRFLKEFPDLPEVKKQSISTEIKRIHDIKDFSSALEIIDNKQRHEQILPVLSGEFYALKTLENFFKSKLINYDKDRNNPVLDGLSNLSPYLHFGQISPLFAGLEASKYEGNAVFLEEMIVRRELSFNFVYYNKDYDLFRSLPNWSKQTLLEHREDKREYLYTLRQLEEAETHDEAWNASQMEMVKTGKMHSYMRMYWGKKIIEWSSDPEEAFNTALYLNNKYELDGRDPNAFTGVGWCFGKHDRPWRERSIFGMVRYMNYEGLKRKFKLSDYISKISMI